MARKLARHKKLAKKSRARRAARPRTAITSNTTVYSASAWHRNYDPSMQVIALNKKDCEAKIYQMMQEEAQNVADENLMYDEGDELSRERAVEEALDDIAWSGVHAFSIGDLVSGRELDEAIRELKSSGYFYPETP